MTMINEVESHEIPQRARVRPERSIRPATEIPGFGKHRSLTAHSLWRQNAGGVGA